MSIISSFASSSTIEKLRMLLPNLDEDEKTQPFELRTITISSQQETLVAFSLFGRETDEISEFCDFLIDSQLMKMISPSRQIAAECERPPKSATGS